jgi:hypothetical protein
MGHPLSQHVMEKKKNKSSPDFGLEFGPDHQTFVFVFSNHQTKSGSRA